MPSSGDIALSATSTQALSWRLRSMQPRRCSWKPGKLQELSAAAWLIAKRTLPNAW